MAVAFPMPFDPPVTSATLPSSLPVMFSQIPARQIPFQAARFGNQRAETVAVRCYEASSRAFCVLAWVNVCVEKIRAEVHKYRRSQTCGKILIY